jgi:sugar phosphate isomerase/epimerase
MKLSKKAGFDGVEIFNFQRFWRNSPEKCRAVARKNNLDIHFHQIWFREKGDHHLHNRILDGIGCLPSFNSSLEGEFGKMYEPVVLYPYRWKEALGKPNYWFQTHTHYRNGKLLISFEDFCKAVVDNNLSVVFDTQHVLEFMLGKMDGVKSLPTNKKEIMSLLEEAWQILGPYTKEIHLNDYHPPYHNVFPFFGVFPLNWFVSMVKDSAWSGTVIPEVDPRHLLKHSLSERLSVLRYIVAELFP